MPAMNPTSMCHCLWCNFLTLAMGICHFLWFLLPMMPLICLLCLFCCSWAYVIFTAYMMPLLCLWFLYFVAIEHMPSQNFFWIEPTSLNLAHCPYFYFPSFSIPINALTKVEIDCVNSVAYNFSGLFMVISSEDMYIYPNCYATYSYITPLPSVLYYSYLW
jgi:hypothetical protein